MILKNSCNICKVPITYLIAEKDISGIKFVTYNCGHQEMLPERGKVNIANITSKDGLKLRKYQIDGINFGIKANARILIADEMGIGKTWQGLGILASDPKLLTPTLIICKQSLKLQWAREIVRLLGNDFVPQIIEGEDDYILPLKTYIISYDILNGTSHERVSKRGDKKIVYKGIQNLDAFVDKISPNLIIMDEIQHIKNSESKRTQAVRKVCKHSSHIVALSGTPIKNNAAEYYPILNILHPERFPSFMHYDRKYLQSYWNGYANKVGGLKNVEQFKEDTKDFIIRRTRSEVLPDLPSISRNTQFCDLGPVVESAYKDTLKQFQDYYNGDGQTDAAITKSANILAYLSKMRHLTGLAKIEPAIEYIQDFIAETDRKIIIFLHHKDVAEILLAKLAQLEIRTLSLDSSMSSQERNNTVLQFKTNAAMRVIICSTLVAGEGIDGLQVASDCLFLERQWNPANEEQAEGRIVRLGQSAAHLTATYFISIGTVDEFFSEIVEKKRSIIGQTLDGIEMQWDQSSIMSELADALANSGGKKWGF